MGRPGWIPTTAILMAVTGCGGRADLLGTSERGGGTASADGGNGDATTEGDSGSHDGAAPVDERGPPPVPVCTAAENGMCVAPEAGLVWTSSAAITCQPVAYPGPWTLILERLTGTNFVVVQTQVVQEPGFGWTFNDLKPPPGHLTYRVCVVESDHTVQCGASLTTLGTASCACEPTSCYLQSACNTTIDDECGSKLNCGACINGNQCNPENDTCCPHGFMPDLWGGCVCAPLSPKACREGWDTTCCCCAGGGAPTPPRPPT